jgi:malonyl-CoA O-methyltransferase
MLVSPREAYRQWAATYDDAPNPILSLVDRNLKVPGGIVIDVACGTGRRGGIGVDLSMEMLARSDGMVAQADARQLPFATGVADVALCILALGYISPVRTVMEEMRRITRPGGVIIASDVAAGWKRAFRQGDAVYEIETHAYSFDDLDIGLTLEESRELHFGEPERLIYAQAGRLDLFQPEIPALWMRRWRR